MQSPLKQYIRRFLNLRYYLKDPSRSIVKKIIAVFGIIYLLSPLDLLPEPVFGIGILDDLILWGLILSFLSKELDSYTGTEGVSREARKRYKGTKIFESEARVVTEEEESMEGKEKK